MLLTDREIRNAGVVRFDNDNHYGSTSYDLSIKSIIDSSGNVHEDQGYDVKPQEIVWVVSKERIILPAEITAHAVIRTSLCNRGLLALNIGIVDPGWDGPLATAIINFSSTIYYLKPKEKFLRLSFYQHEKPQLFKKIVTDDSEYLQERKKLAIEKFGSTFLNIEAIANKIKENFIGSWKEKVMLWAAVGAASLAFLSVFAAVATYLIPWPASHYKDDIQSLQQRVLVLETLLNHSAKPLPEKATE